MRRLAGGGARGAGSFSHPHPPAPSSHTQLRQMSLLSQFPVFFPSPSFSLSFLLPSFSSDQLPSARRILFLHSGRREGCMGNGGKKMGSGKLLRIVGVARGRLEKVEGSRRLVVDTQLEKMCSRIPITVGHFLVLQFSTKECAKTHSGLRASKSPSVNCSDDAPPPISAKKIRNTLLSPPLRSRDTKNVTKLLLARFRPPKKNWGGRTRRFFLPV